MASQSNIAITQLVQLGLTEKVAQELQSHPEILRQTAQQVTPELLRQQQSAVQKTEDTDKNDKIATRDRERQNSRRGFKKKRKKTPLSKAEDDDPGAAPPGTWTGHLLNVKV